MFFKTFSFFMLPCAALVSGWKFQLLLYSNCLTFLRVFILLRCFFRCFFYLNTSIKWSLFTNRLKLHSTYRKYGSISFNSVLGFMYFVFYIFHTSNCFVFYAFMFPLIYLFFCSINPNINWQIVDQSSKNIKRENIAFWVT